jgi:flagellar biogenesis protein FliO
VIFMWTFNGIIRAIVLAVVLAIFALCGILYFIAWVVEKLAAKRMKAKGGGDGLA